MSRKRITVYDTTLRDGAQAEKVSFSLNDKLAVAEALDDFGVHYIEGGWPGSNPRDKAFFFDARKLKLSTSKIVAFGSTHHPKSKPSSDNNVKLLLGAKTPCVMIVGKSWDMQAGAVLGISKNRNLDLIHDTIAYLDKNVDEVMFDAEHFFDGYKSNPEYAIKTLQAALDAGASWLTLCDTNGGAMPFEVEKIVADVAERFPKVKLAIHCHNDSENAVASTIAAVRSGALQVQGTINGIGERCGNANLCSVIPNLQLKMGYTLIPARKMTKLRSLSRLVYELANLAQRPSQPYVGRSAFAHKGGIHVAAIRKKPAAYEHIEPEAVGNRRRVLVSDLSGKWNVLLKAEEFGIDLKSKDQETKNILAQLKELESQGFQFEGGGGFVRASYAKSAGAVEEKIRGGQGACNLKLFR